MRAYGPAGAILLMLLSASVPAWSQDAEQRRGFSITITDPVDQEVAFGRVRIVADVKLDEPEMLDRVEFMVGDRVVFIDREPPWECTHDFGSDSKSWIIRAVAYHKEGPTVSDAVITRRMRFSAFEEVNRVILWVTVTGKKDALITDLDKADFKVEESGQEQKIIDFYLEDRPINLAILLDTSGSAQESMEEVHTAAESFVKTLRPEDKALVIDFDERVFLIQELTSDHDALQEAVTSTEAIGGTALYDAFHAAYRKLRGVQGRKAIILLSDGADTASQFGYKRVLEEAKANNIMIFAIGLSAGSNSTLDRNVLKEFTEVTGGRLFVVGKAADLGDVYQRIAEELRAQYYLTYSTSVTEWDGHWVKLKVHSDVPEHKVRARRGFFAVKAAE